LKEDFKDLHDIKKQKQEQKDSKEEIPDWEFGKGIKDKEPYFYCAKRASITKILLQNTG